MMEKTFEQFLEKNYPAGLHKRVMRQAWFFRYRKIFFTGAGFTAVYATASAFMLFSQMAEMEFFSAIKEIFSNINFNLELLADAVQTSVALAPAEYIMNSLAGLICAAFSAYIFKKFYKLSYN